MLAHLSQFVEESDGFPGLWLFHQLHLLLENLDWLADAVVELPRPSNFASNWRQVPQERRIVLFGIVLLLYKLKLLQVQADCQVPLGWDVQAGQVQPVKAKRSCFLCSCCPYFMHVCYTLVTCMYCISTYLHVLHLHE